MKWLTTNTEMEKIQMEVEGKNRSVEKRKMIEDVMCAMNVLDTKYPLGQCPKVENTDSLSVSHWRALVKVCGVIATRLDDTMHAPRIEDNQAAVATKGSWDDVKKVVQSALDSN